MSIRDQSIANTPFAVIDLETTGLSPGRDRVVEVAVVRASAREEPRLVLETLVNPERRMAATEIHGITDKDVERAPVFAEVAPLLRSALAGCMVAAHNVYFDMRFLDDELERAKQSTDLPHLCTMYLRPMLGLGKRCSLAEACGAHGVRRVGEHTAAGDALAAAKLLRVYLREIESRHIGSFGDLAKLKKYKFVRSFSCEPPTAPATSRGKPKLIPRSGMPVAEAPAPTNAPFRDYLIAVIDAVSDLDVTQEELDEVRAARTRLGVSEPEVRAAHARVFSAVIDRFVEDRSLDDDERDQLRKLHHCLRTLGWAPGE